MKDGWEIKKLKEIAEIISGQSPESSYYNTSKDGLPFYQGKIEFTKKYIAPPKIWTSKITKQAIAGDILMSVRAPVGPTNFATEDCCIGRGLAAIRVGNTVDREFLYLYFQTIEEKLMGKEGAVFNSLTRDQIKNIDIPLPPLSEQKEIVAILDDVLSRIDKARENIKKNIENAKELYENAVEQVVSGCGEQSSHLNHHNSSTETAADLLKEIAKERESLIRAGKIKKSKPLPEITEDEIPYEIPENWEWVRLGDVILENVGGGTPDKSKPEYWNGVIPWASVKDLKSNSLDETIDKITPAGLENSSSNLIPKGNVIVCTRMGLGKVAINSINVAINQDLRALILSKYVSKEYFVNYYSTLIIEGDGATVKGISINTLHNYLFPLPPLSEQKKIVAELDALEKQRSTLTELYTKKLQALDELRNSVLEKAFRGELT